MEGEDKLNEVYLVEVTKLSKEKPSLHVIRRRHGIAINSKLINTHFYKSDSKSRLMVDSSIENVWRTTIYYCMHEYVYRSMITTSNTTSILPTSISLS